MMHTTVAADTLKYNDPVRSGLPDKMKENYKRKFCSSARLCVIVGGELSK